MNINTDIKRAPFPSGVFIVRGEQGIGKTSFCTALLCSDYKKWRKWRTQEGLRLAQEYYAYNRIPLNISDRLYFSNIKILLDKRKKLYTHYIDVQRLGLPNPDFDVQYLPRGSVVYIQEADVLLFCRDWQGLNTYLVNLLKYVRHNLLTVIFDCQVDSMLDKAVRSLTVDMYHIERSYDKRFFIFWKRRFWKFICIHNQLNNALKELATVGVKLRGVSVLERGTFRFGSDIFSRYNSFSGVPYFLNGIEKKGYEYLEHPVQNLSIPGIQSFLDHHPLTRPEEMKRKGETKKRKEEPKTDSSNTAA